MTEYVLELEEPARSQILKELEQMISKAFEDDPIAEVIVATDFGKAVVEHSPSGENARYDPVHDYGVAVAKTIPVSTDDELRFIIIFDVRLFADLSGIGSLVRNGKIVHEMVHVKNGLMRFRQLGKAAFIKIPKAKSETLVENAWRLWEEYDAERTVAEMIDSAAKLIGNVTRVDYNETLTFAEDTKTKIAEFGPFLTESLMKYRNWKLTIEELSYSFTSRVASVLILLGYVFAIAGVSEGVRQKILLIEESLNFEKYFAVGWTLIIQCLEEFYNDRMTYRADILQRIGEAIDAIWLACSLRITDHPAGFYVQVLDTNHSSTTT